jgi:hypothetical protein
MWCCPSDWFLLTLHPELLMCSVSNFYCRHPFNATFDFNLHSTHKPTPHFLYPLSFSFVFCTSGSVSCNTTCITTLYRLKLFFSALRLVWLASPFCEWRRTTYGPFPSAVNWKGSSGLRSFPLCSVVIVSFAAAGLVRDIWLLEWTLIPFSRLTA